jgi:hypothetical protein
VPCASLPASQYFARWGDKNYYFLVPGGNFQLTDLYPWTGTGGAHVVSGGDPWNVTGQSNPVSALIPPGGAETSMQFCVDSTQNAIRFFYKSPGVAGSALLVSVNVTSGSNVATNTVDIAGSSAGWAVSSVMDLPYLYDCSGHENVTISFSPANTPATWQVDDVMIDPFASL